MGYYYDIDGNIQFNSKKAFAIMKYLHKEKQEPFEEEIEGFEFDDKNLNLKIDINIKNYDNFTERMCLLAHTLDKKAYGEMIGIGEDNEDKFDITINEKGIKISIAEIIWKNQRGYFKDADTIKNAKILLKDKELNKKLICSVLEEKDEK